MVITDRIRSVTFSDTEKEALAEASRILCSLYDEMCEDEIIDGYETIDDCRNIYDVSCDLLKMSECESITLRTDD